MFDFVIELMSDFNVETTLIFNVDKMLNLNVETTLSLKECKQYIFIAYSMIRPFIDLIRAWLTK